MSRQEEPSGTLAANRTAQTKTRHGRALFSIPSIAHDAPECNHQPGQFHFTAASDAKRRGDRARYLYHRRAGLLCQGAAYMREEVTRGT